MPRPGPFFCAPIIARGMRARRCRRFWKRSPDYLIKGYSADHRIVYGTGIVIPQAEMMGRAEAIFADERVRLHPHPVVTQQLLSGADRPAVRIWRRAVAERYLTPSANGRTEAIAVIA